MNIIYTVAGEGYGHAFRSFPTIRHLKDKGHNVLIVASDKSYAYLSTEYLNVKKITSLNIAYEDNAVKKFETVILNLKKIKDLPENIKTFAEIEKNFKPDLVITDFEPMGFYFAELNRVPLISIDNMHIITDAKIKAHKGDRTDSFISKTIIKAMIPTCDYAFINTFFYPEIKNRKKSFTFLVPPIIRDEILKTKTQKGEHILVYQTSKSYTELLNVLKSIKNEKFLVYNTDQNLKAKNIVYREFNDKQILEDFAKAKGVIANGGFTLISEALYLNKPIYSVPVAGQYEQILNARMIQRMGLGKMSKRITRGAVKSWLKNLDTFETNTKKIIFDNDFLFKKLDEILAEIKEEKVAL